MSQSRGVYIFRQIIWQILWRIQLKIVAYDHVRKRFCGKWQPFENVRLGLIVKMCSNPILIILVSSDDILLSLQIQNKCYEKVVHFLKQRATIINVTNICIHKLN